MFIRIDLEVEVEANTRTTLLAPATFLLYESVIQILYYGLVLHINSHGLGTLYKSYTMDLSCTLARMGLGLSTNPIPWTYLAHKLECV